MIVEFFKNTPSTLYIIKALKLCSYSNIPLGGLKIKGNYVLEDGYPKIVVLFKYLACTLHVFRVTYIIAVIIIHCGRFCSQRAWFIYVYVISRPGKGLQRTWFLRRKIKNFNINSAIIHIGILKYLFFLFQTRFSYSYTPFSKYRVVIFTYG